MIQKIILIWILIVFVGGWYLRFRTEVHKFRAVDDGSRLLVEGRITSQPYQKNSKQIMRIGGVRLVTEAFPRYEYGDLVQVVGRVKKQVTKLGVSELWLMYPKIVKVDNRIRSMRWNGFGIRYWLYKFRRKIERKYRMFLPQPHAALLSGIVLGAKGFIPQSFYQDLQNTGTMHVVVASGYNVTVVAAVLLGILVKAFSRKWAVIGAFIGVAAYTLMAGAEPPVVRAGMMAVFLIMSQFFGRQYQAVWALFLASLIMMFFSPLVILDIGFQLSVVATLGLLILAPVLQQRFANCFSRAGKVVTQELAVVVAAQVMVFPLLLVNFGRVSLLSPVVNLMVGWLVPVIMGLGAVLAMIGLIGMSLGQMAAYVAWMPLDLFVKLVSWFSEMEFAVKDFGKISGWWSLIYYAAVFAFILRQRNVLERSGSLR